MKILQRNGKKVSTIGKTSVSKYIRIRDPVSSLSIEARWTWRELRGVLISHDRENAISWSLFFPSHRTRLNRWFNRGARTGTRQFFSFPPSGMYIHTRVQCTHIRVHICAAVEERNLSKLYFRVKRCSFSFPFAGRNEKVQRAIFTFHIDDHATRYLMPMILQIFAS